MTAEQLAPCPFCGTSPKGVITSTGSDERNGYNFSATITCPGCGGTISRPSHQNKMGWCDDTGQAVASVTEAWNRRVS